jgi:Transcription factor subunit Med10 of Mediator complex
VYRDIDSNRNPHLVTKDRVERAAAENQFTSGKLAAIEVSFFPRGILDSDSLLSIL